MDLQSARSELTSRPPVVRFYSILVEIAVVLAIAGVIALIFG